MVSGTPAWDMPLVHHLFPSPVREAILNICIPPREEHDVLMCVASMSGRFSVRSAHRAIHLMHSTIPAVNTINWSYIWKSTLHPRHKMLLWKLMSNCFATKDRIYNFLPNTDMSCCICNNVTESITHLFVHCPLTLLIWANSP